MTTAGELFPPTSGATVSDDGVYRYELWRHWGPGDAALLWVMLNPSTADASEDDPTIRKCIGFSKRLGYHGLRVVNLFALRATDPKALARHGCPVGPDNDAAIVTAAARCSGVMAAWGSHKMAPRRAAAVLALLGERPVDCLRLSGGGNPWHPLYVPYEVELVSFRRKP